MEESERHPGLSGERPAPVRHRPAGESANPGSAADPETQQTASAPETEAAGNRREEETSPGNFRRNAMRRAGRRRRSRQRLLWLALPLMLVFSILGLWRFAGSTPDAGYTPPRVVLLPLDSRPVNTELPIQLASAGGISVTSPEAAILDQFLTPSQPEPLYEWLKANTGGSDEVVILHVNQLLFGGLLNSREEVQYRDASDKLLALQDYLLQLPPKPNQKMVLIYILPRLLPSQYDQEMWAYEKELTELSQLKHKMSADPEDLSLYSRVYELESAVPQEIRHRYETLYVQAYNTGLNLLDWAGQGYADEVLIGLDDSAEYGLNIKVFNDLKSIAAQRGLTKAFFLHGADELAALAIARHSLELGADSATFHLTWLTPGQEETIFPYEAAPLRQNYAEKVNYLYYGKPEGAGSPLEKYIYLNSGQELSAEEMTAAWEAVRNDRRPQGSLAGLADVAKVNGSWQPFIDAIGVDKVYDYVDAYAGWNTAGNSLGTVIAQLVFEERGQSLTGTAARESRQAIKALQRLRLLDDYLYQSVVRPEFIQWTKDQGFNYLVFGDRWQEANEKIQAMMAEAAAPYELFKGFSYRFRFPWPRYFEIGIQEARE
ncbi:MAG: DUF4127 family protein [Peptococcaceae bacterium]|nr:DUF4127 family protein [Peptococcaceae bacterium]